MTERQPGRIKQTTFAYVCLSITLKPWHIIEEGTPRGLSQNQGKQKQGTLEDKK